MTVGGASGPLYGTFFMAAGDALAQKRGLPEDMADVFASAVGAVSARGRSQAGEKTMLDVLFPVLETLRSEAGRPDLIERVRATASAAVERTAPMQATKGRAAFLGARSVGHVDPGARSSCVLLHAVCDTLEARQ
jgi:phosphoenolpyruvate---glycerone phosphotransferase subunit DhaL